MAVAAAIQNSQIPSVPELLRRAEEIGTIARERAVDIERARQISADLVDKMRAAELFRIMQPRRYGGFEYGYDVFVEAVSAVASGDGSTGWVYSLGAVHPWMIGCYPDEAQHDFWEQGARTPSPLFLCADRQSHEGEGRLSPQRDAGVSRAAATTRNGAFLGGIIPSRRTAPKPGFFLVPRTRLHHSTTTGTRWASPAPAARPSVMRTRSCRPIASSRFADLLAGTGPGRHRSTGIRSTGSRCSPSLPLMPGLARARHGARRAEGLYRSGRQSALRAALSPAATTHGGIRDRPDCGSPKRPPRSTPPRLMIHQR